MANAAGEWNSTSSVLKISPPTVSGQASIFVFFSDVESISGHGGETNFRYQPGSTTQVLVSDIALDFSETPAKSVPFLNYLTMHEMGHSLGLQHPLGGSGYAADFNTDMTIMSYIDPNGIEAGTSLQAILPATPMALDVAVIQDKYGLGTVRGGDDDYSYSSHTSSTTSFSGDSRSWTIVDTGGSDKIDLSASSQNQRIDLREALDSNGNWQTYADTTFGGYHSVVDGKEHVYIARGSIIETARGGTGNDTILATPTAAARCKAGRATT